jgi:hypothetical protein
MASDPENREQKTERHDSNSDETLKGARIISYNLTEEQRPGGMKVRFKIRIETGRKAAAIDAAQADALRELLEWSREHRTARSKQ